MIKKSYLSRCVAYLTLMFALTASNANGSDILYVGDGADNTIKGFDANTGEYLGAFVKKGNSPIKGPMGLVFEPMTGNLLLSNQNSGTNKSGELLEFESETGDYLGALISHTNPDAPFAPRGIILSDDTIFVASTSSFGRDKTNPPGNLLAYAVDGALLADLTPDSSILPAEFHPRGVVMGPDGLLYVSVTDDLQPKSDSFNPVPGWILRFNPSSGNFVDVFADYDSGRNDCSGDLHRPEGLVFGPDDHLYVTAFRKDAGDNDKILIFSLDGSCIDQIDLDEIGQPRAYAQAILFGPNGDLFVPINNTGEVRRYDLNNGSVSTFVAPGGPLGSPWYLTFGRTDPGTLDYLE